MYGVLAQSLHIYSGLWLLVDCKGVLSLRVSKHIIKLLVVKLDQADPHGGLSFPTFPAARLYDASATRKTDIHTVKQWRRWAECLSSGVIKGRATTVHLPHWNATGTVEGIQHIGGQRIAFARTLVMIRGKRVPFPLPVLRTGPLPQEE